jgi:hypothetical protein
VIAAILAVALGAALDTPAPAGGTSRAEALFTAAREARTQSAYAHYTVYATVVRFRRGGRAASSTWDTVEDMRRRLVHAHGFSREENAHPHVPHGINIGIAGGASGVLGPGEMPSKGQVVNHEPSDDPIGELTFAIDQDFGLALNAPRIGSTPDMSEVSQTVATLPRIGRTGIIARTYDVTDLGDVVENGITLHHLGLRPLRDPRRYRLRALWTDAKTALPVRAIVAGVGNRTPLENVDWRVDFAQDQGGTYVAREAALGPLDVDGVRLDDLTITFEERRPTNRLTGEESLGFSESVGTTDP